MVFNDITWSHTDLDQARKRIHRIGQDRVCFCHYIYGSKFDKLVTKIVASKVRETEKVDAFNLHRYLL